MKNNQFLEGFGRQKWALDCKQTPLLSHGNISPNEKEKSYGNGSREPFPSALLNTK